MGLQFTCKFVSLKFIAKKTGQLTCENVLVVIDSFRPIITSNLSAVLFARYLKRNLSICKPVMHITM